MNPNTHKQILRTFFFALLIQLQNPINASPSPPITAIYAFGDSTVDPGNNNYSPTVYQANHAPYGKSFPGKFPSGRFSDGLLATDFLAAAFRIKPTLPAYINPFLKPVDLLTGVSFASGGTGLDPKTGNSSAVISLDKQWTYFQESVRKMKGLVGSLETNRVVKNAVFVISAGTNDMIYNVYGLPTKPVSVSAYHDLLLSNVEAFVQRLYSGGARRIVVAGLPPVGCVPIQVTLGGLTSSRLPRFFQQRICVENQNVDSRLYNLKLQKLNLRLSNMLQGSKVLYLDIYTPIADMVKYPRKYGLEHTLQGCCGTGVLEVGPLCQPLSRTCNDVSKYLFFDSVHPSQKGYSVIADYALQTLVPLI